MHLFIGASPDAAAKLTWEFIPVLGDLFMADVVRTLAYDLYWSSRESGPNVSPAADVRYLTALASLSGEDWLESRFADAARRMNEDAVAGITSQRAVNELIDVLIEGSSAAEDGSKQKLLVGRLLGTLSRFAD